MADISNPYTMSLFGKLTNYDFKNMFLTTKLEMFNHFEVDIEWDINVNEAILTAKNFHI